MPMKSEGNTLSRLSEFFNSCDTELPFFVYRKNLQMLCLNLLQEVEIKTLKPVIQLYFNLRTNLNESICKVTSEVNNLLHPSGAETSIPITVQERDTDKTLNTCVTPELEKPLRFKVMYIIIRSTWNLF
jgi:hypothetical protein